MQTGTDTALPLEEPAARRQVLLFIGGKSLLLPGDWHWDLYTSSVFCSDVLLSHTRPFWGTRGLIHPEDLPLLKENLAQQEGKTPFNLHFRIITTYGEIKTLCGSNLLPAEDDLPEVQPFADLEETEQNRAREQKEREAAEITMQGVHLSERHVQTGTWFINASTHEAAYSDGVFRLYGLAPQSLNAHPNTFMAFLHPDDRAHVTEAFEKAFHEQVPLHLEFRIVRPDEQERTLRQTTQWIFSPRGEHILHGVVQDITEERERDHQLAEMEHREKFLHQLLKLHDQSTGSGYFYINLITRKMVYSDNYFRIFGMKPQPGPGAVNSFLYYVHPEDQKHVEEAFRKMKYEHAAPELEYRIIRPDGKTRFIRQTGKPEIFGGSELMMLGIIQDITAERTAEMKVRELQEKLQIAREAGQLAESIAGSGHWLLDLQSGKSAWSDNLFRLLGYKPHSVEPDQALLLKLVYPDDRKRFTDELDAVLGNQPGNEFEFHVGVAGERRLLRAVFAMVRYEDKMFLTGAFRDISEPFRQHRQFSERIQLAEMLAENIPDLVLMTDTDHNIIFWNKQCETVFGLKKPQVLQKNFFDVFPHLKHEKTISWLKEATAGRAVFETHQPALTAGTGFIDLHLIPLKDAGESVIGVLHIVRDVSEEARLKESLGQRLRFIDSLLQATVDRIVVLDRNMNYLYWNRKSEEYYGIPKEQVIGKNILEVFPQLISDPSYNEFRRALRGETVHVPVQEALKDGYFFETWLVPVTGENGAVNAVLWISHDFTKEFRAKKEQLEAFEVLDTMMEACLRLDESGRVTFANRNAGSLLQQEREGITGKNIWELLPDSVDQPLYFAVNHALSEKVPVRRKIFFHTFRRQMYVTISPAGNGVIILFFDCQEEQ